MILTENNQFARDLCFYHTKKRTKTQTFFLALYDIYEPDVRSM